MISDDERAADTAKSSFSKAGPTKTPGRRDPGRKPKQAAGVEAATLPQDTAAEQAGATTHPTAAGLGDKAAAASGEAASRTASAAHWNQATDAVRFDWPAIERVASAAGPNQGMARLLVAARAEGAGSRWPL